MEPIDHARIFVADHREPLGRAMVARLRQAGGAELLLRSPRQLDLRDDQEVEAFFATQKPDLVVLPPEAAARGGDAEWLHDAVARICTVARAAQRHGTRKLVHVVSDAVYPQEAPLPLREDGLWSGPLAADRRAEALAGLLAVESCDAVRRDAGADFVTAVLPPTFGPHMAFDAETPHPLARMLRQAHEARVRGEPSVHLALPARARHASLFAADAADGLAFVLRGVSGPGPVNVAADHELPLEDWAEHVRAVVDYRGRIVFDAGAAPPRRVLDGTRLRARGWRPRTSVREALERTYAGYLQRFGGRAPHRVATRPLRPSRPTPGRL